MISTNFDIDNLEVAYTNKSTKATELELHHWDHKIYSAIKQIRGQKNVQISIAQIKELLKLLTSSAEWQNNRLNRNKNSHRLNESSLDILQWQICFLLLKNSHLIYLDTSQFPRTTEPNSMIDFCHPDVNIWNVFGELTPVKFSELLIVNEPENNITYIVLYIWHQYN